MATYYRPASIVHSGPAAASPGRLGASPDITLGAPLSTVGFAADPLVPTTLVASLASLGVAVELLEVVIYPTGGGALAADPAIMRAVSGDTSWTTTTIAGATLRLANGGVCISQSSNIVADGVVVSVPWPSLRIASAALAKFSAVAGPGGTGPLTVRVCARPRYTPTSAALGLFFDVPGDTNGYNATTNLLTRLRAGGTNTSLQLGGTAANGGLMLDCNVAGVSPYRTIWCAASDIGVSTPDYVRLPTALASNAASAYSRYPAVFLRSGPYSRGAEYGARDNESAITTIAGALTILVTSVDLHASEWLVMIDGVVMTVIINHSTLVGLRRPGDIWNRVFVNALSRNTPLQLCSPNAGLPPTGQLQQMESLQYACFLRGYTLDGDSPIEAFTPYGQAGNPAPA